jgi:RNA polymerase sigma-70 factor, ECF subfamily
MQGTVERYDQTDTELVESSRQGDNDAFGELVSRHYRRCVDLANLFVRNHWDAEDQVQIACSKAHERLHQFHGDSEFVTWLSRIVTNQCLMFMRVRRRARFVYLDDASPESEAPPLELAARGPDPEGELAVNELKQVLRTEIRHIPPLLRNLVLLRDIQELPMSAIAEELQISVPAAKSRLLRARSELRLRLKDKYQNIGSQSPLSKSAVPLSRVAHHRAVQRLMAAGA